MSIVDSQLKIKQLDDHSFFYGMRNEFTQKRFTLIKKLATALPRPPRYGIYLNNKHHLDIVNLLLLATTETRHRGLFLLREVLPQIKNTENLLDIGPGNGLITKWISSRFKQLTIIDNNDEAIQRTLNVIRVKERTSVETIHNSILNVTPRKNYYNLSLLAHVLYYVAQGKWLEVTQRAYNALAPGGLLVIILNGDQYGKADLIKHFGGQMINTDSFIMQCANTFSTAKVTIFKSMEVAKTQDLCSMLYIAGLFLSDSKTTAQKDDLIKYVNTHFRNTPSEYYTINFSQKFILLQKPILAPL